MAYKCAQCGRFWDDESAIEMEMTCTRRCGGALVADSTSHTDERIAELPSIIAIPFQDFFRESYPILRLHRLCDVAEIVTRFATIVSLGELRQGGEPLSDNVTKVLQPHIERPTFGQWRDMLAALTPHVASRQSLVLPELVDAVRQQLLPALNDDASRDHPQGLIGLRNDLVHSGAIPKSWAASRLGLWESWLSGLLESLRVLREVEVSLLADGVARRLVGVLPDTDDRPLPPGEWESLKPLDHHVVLMRANSILDLWPLCDYGHAVKDPACQTSRDSSESPMIYIRVDKARLVYAALGVDLPHGERADILDEFNALFRPSCSPEVSCTPEALDFEEELREQARSVIGRKDEIRHIKAAIKSTKSGVLWVGGRAGIGKSILASKLANDLRGDPRKGCRLFWRFNVGDDARCSRSAFLRYAVKRLSEHLGISQKPTLQSTEDALPELRELLKQVPAGNGNSPQSTPQRIIIILDGLDAIARSDMGFADIPFSLSLPNVVWVCFGRHGSDMTQMFPPERCYHVFPDGIPPMAADDIRAMLIDGTGSLKYNMLRLDKEAVDKDGEPRISNIAVETVVERSQGLPLYVYFVVQDLQSGVLRFEDLPRQAPPSLHEYYEVILHRLAIGDLQALMTPLLVTLAWSEAALDEEMLLYLLGQRGLLSEDADGLALLRRGLNAIESIVNRAPVPGWHKLGYEPYHATLREHVRADTRATLTQQNQAAKESFCSAIQEWHSLPSKHPARRYALRYGPRTLQSVGRVTELANLLRDHRFLEEKAGLVSELIDDLTLASQVVDQESALLFELLSEAMRRDINFLVEVPEALFRCVWNTCWWYDCPAAATHYVDTGVDESPAPPWKSAEAPVHRYCESWRAAKEAAEPGFHWVRSLRPPFPHLGGALISVMRQHPGYVDEVGVSPDGTRTVGYSLSGYVTLWDTWSGRLLEECDTWARGKPVFSADGQRLLLIDGGCVKAVWDARTGKPLPKSIGIEASKDEAALAARSHVSVSAEGTVEVRSLDGRYMAIGSRNGEVTLHDLCAGEIVFQVLGHSRAVKSIAFSSRGDFFVTGAEDFTLRAWATSSAMHVRELRDPTLEITCVASSLDGCHVATGATDGIVRIFERETAKEIWRFPTHTQPLASIDYSPDGSQVITGSKLGDVCAWDLESGRRLFRLDCGRALAQAWYPWNGQLMIEYSDNGEQLLFDLATCQVSSKPKRGYPKKPQDPGIRCSDDSVEVMFYVCKTNQCIASFPRELSKPRSDSTGEVWTGRVGNKSYLLVIEGCPVTTCAEHDDGSCGQVDESCQPAPASPTMAPDSFDPLDGLEWDESLEPEAEHKCGHCGGYSSEDDIVWNEKHGYHIFTCPICGYKAIIGS